MKKGIVYYTDNHCDELILKACRTQLLRCIPNFDIVSVSQQPLDLGRNFVIEGLKRGPVSLFKQALKGIRECRADVIFLIEHDLIYHPSHFLFEPPDKNVFYYDRHRYAVDPDTGKSVFYHCNALSLLVAYKSLLLEHFSRRVEILEKDGFRSSMGYSPPKGLPKEERKRYRTYMAEFPSLDIRHDNTLTRKRMHKSQFRSERSCRGWTETYDIPGWGRIENFNRFLARVIWDAHR